MWGDVAAKFQPKMKCWNRISKCEISMHVSQVCSIYIIGMGYTLKVIRFMERGGGTLSPGPPHFSDEALSRHAQNCMISPVTRTLWSFFFVIFLYNFTLYLLMFGSISVLLVPWEKKKKTRISTCFLSLAESVLHAVVQFSIMFLCFIKVKLVTS